MNPRPIVVWTKQHGSISLDVACEFDKPEGVCTIEVSATLLRELYELADEHGYGVETRNYGQGG